MTDRPEHPLVAPVVGGTPERPFQTCHCPAAQGEDCPLTQDECDARAADYLGQPWFGARLRKIWESFVRESANGVVCSIPDTGLNTPPHRTWCARCQRRYMELKALVDMLESRSAALVPRPEPREPEPQSLPQKWREHAQWLRRSGNTFTAARIEDCASDLENAAVRPASASSLEQSHYTNAHNGQVMPESCVACRAFAILNLNAFSTREDMIRAIDAYRKGEAASAPSRPLEEVRRQLDRARGEITGPAEDRLIDVCAALIDEVERLRVLGSDPNK